MDEINKEKVKIYCFWKYADTIYLREEKKRSLRKINNIKELLNNNYKGKEQDNYMNDFDESLELIINDILSEEERLNIPYLDK